MKAGKWGFDTRNMDTRVRPQDDFYLYVNGGWKKKNPIPNHESRWGTFMKLRHDVDRQLKVIIEELLVKKRVAAGSPEQIIRDFFRSGFDMKRRNALGISPLMPYLKKIRSVTSRDQLVVLIARMAHFGVEVPWSTCLDQDDKNSERYVLRFVQSGLGLPERDYYLGKDKESVRVRTAYSAHVEAMYRLIGTKEAKQAAEAHLRLEIELAKASMKKEDRRDPHKTYTKMTIAGLQKIAPSVNWRRYLTVLGVKSLSSVIVNQPKFMTRASILLETIPLSIWKNYVAWHLVNSFYNSLSLTFARQGFSFYGKVLTGSKAMRPLWRRVLGAVNSRVGELLGRLYVDKHFPPEAKKKMEQLVEDLFTAYEARIQTLDWMSSKTKKKALRKLAALNRKIGYPDKWKSYRGLVIRPDDYVGNLIRSAEYEHRRDMKKLQRPVDRSEWFMYPQTVNAYFSPNLNDIVFPAAILQPPFFSLDADDAVNYGTIGAVIGHEITHGFDDQGSQFDEKGNLKSWWTKADRKRFEKRAEVLRKQFDKYKVADGVKVNGKLTLGENIADLGGAAIALDAYRLRAAKEAAPLLDGFSPTERFFLGFAVFECENTRPEFEKMLVLTDPHSPGQFRINGPASNLEAFYEAFKVQEGDKLYRPRKERARIW